MIPTTATDVAVGDVFDYRGHDATITACWQTQDDSPIKRAPVGIEFTWVDENGNVQNTRMVWPDLTFAERKNPEQDPRGLTDEQVEAQLVDDLAALPILVVELAPDQVV